MNSPPPVSVSLASRMGFACPDANILRISLLLAATLALLPLAMLLPLRVDQSLQLLILPAWWMSSRSDLVRSSPIDRLLLFAAVICTLISLALSPHPARAAVAAAALWWTVAAAMTAHSVASNRAAVRLVLCGLAVGAAVGVIVVRVGESVSDGPMPIYTHPRILGLHLLAGSIAALGWFMLVEKSFLGKIMAVATALVVWTGLAWSGSRAPVLGLVTTLLVWLFAATPDERIKLVRTALVLGLSAMIISYALGPCHGQGWWTALHRTTAAGGDLQALSSTRSDFWMVVWHRIQDAPWFGHGGDAYLFIQPRQVGNQPHNFLLQWILEYGFIGALPMLGLLGRRLLAGSLSALKSPADTATIATRVSTAGLAGITVCALFDGVFYHSIISIPAAVFAGLCVVIPGKRPQTSEAASPHRFQTWSLRAGLLIGALILVLHNGLALALTHTRPPRPDTVIARVLRVFPSETFGLWNWLNTWKLHDPDAALEWARWAQSHAIEPAWFHLYAAQCLWERHEFTAALKEVQTGQMRAASLTEKSELQRFRQALEQQMSSP